MSKESQADPCCKEESKNEVHQVERLISSLQISEDSSKHQSKPPINAKQPSMDQLAACDTCKLTYMYLL